MKIRYVLIAVLSAVLFTACEPAANTNTATNANSNAANANANVNANRAAAPAPTKDELMALERSAWDAWKNKNAGFWEGFLSAKFAGYGQAGRLDKAAAMKEYAGAECDVKSVTITDDQMMQIAPDVAAVSYKVATDGTCGGQKVPASQWSGGLYVRENGKWVGAFHASAPEFDPKAPPAAAKPASQPPPAAAPNSSDPTTTAILAAETKIWEAWKNKDAATLESSLGKDFTVIFGMGRFTRAEAVKMWATESKCEVKSYSLTDAKTTPLANNITLLTFKGGGTGTCDGQPITTEWYGVAYANEGGTWRPVWALSIPA
jgi:hypothetical protein